MVLYVFHGRQYHTSGGTDHKWSSDDVRMICFKRIYYLWPVHCWFVVLVGTLTIALSLCLWQCFWSIIVQWRSQESNNCVIGGSHRHRLAVSLPIICKHENNNIKNKNKNTNTNTNWSTKTDWLLYLQIIRPSFADRMWFTMIIAFFLPIICTDSVECQFCKNVFWGKISITVAIFLRPTEVRFYQMKLIFWRKFLIWWIAATPCPVHRFHSLDKFKKRKR